MKCERKARLHLRKQEDLGQHIEREQLRNIKTHMENILFTKKKERKKLCAVLILNKITFEGGKESK